MAFHLFVTCTSQKTVPQFESFKDTDLNPGSVGEVFQNWHKKISQSPLSKVKAMELYKGDLWKKSLILHEALKKHYDQVNFWIISAGQGLINGEREIVPYAVTFQDAGLSDESLFTKVQLNSKEGTVKKQALREWWQLVQTMNGTLPISTLIGNGNEKDCFLFVLGKEYLTALLPELTTGIQNSRFKNKVAIISNSKKDSEMRSLGKNLLFNSPDFRNLPATNSITVNASIALDIIGEIGNIAESWDVESLNDYLSKRVQHLDKSVLHDRQKSSDEDVKKFIIDYLLEKEHSASELNRIFRDSGRACEQKRFTKLYYEVVGGIKESTSRKKKLPAVNFKPRNGSIKFFLPDNDDRVDPDFDFQNERSQPYRDPYENDAYHYELYGELNCDGILVSKGVLESSSDKRRKVEDKGIHGFLRLPDHVPIIGDCGAFSYIMEEDPPYETGEIVDYYHLTGFNFGVSIDHLIIPFVYTRYNHYHYLDGQLIEVDDKKFHELQKKGMKVYPKRELIPQQFFGCEALVKEEYIDIIERQRRYDITLKNGLDFIEIHRKKGYYFEPVGAVQGWDPESYAQMAKEFIDNGYKYIALGSLVRSRNKEILDVVDEVNRIRPQDVKLHVFGVGRKDLIEPFKERGVSSVDNAGILRQAWLSSTNNYYAEGFNNYSSIRVPIFDEKKHDCLLPNNNLMSNLQKQTLESLRKYGRGENGLSNVLEVVEHYNHEMKVPEKIINTYRRTLENRPWEKCNCRICKEVGIEVIIFRGNNRNRRRGFHNTWFFYQWLKEQ